jgi:hypothetical protein
MTSLITGTARSIRQVHDTVSLRLCSKESLCCLNLFASKDLKVMHIEFYSFLVWCTSSIR